MLSSTVLGSVFLLFGALPRPSLGFRIDIDRIRPRQDDVFQCLYAAYEPCGNGLYGDMCCDSESTCLVTAANTTGICCPNGSDCSAIAPLSCNIDLQDWRVYPDASVMTKALHEALPECDDKCCPHGFVCVAGRGGQSSRCELDPDQDAYTTLMPKMPGFVDDSAVSVTFPSKKPVSTPVSVPGSATSSVQSTSSGQSIHSSSGSASQSRNTASPSATGGPVSGTEGPDEEAIDESDGGLNMALMVGAPVGAALLTALLVFLWFKRRTMLKCYRRRSPTPPPKPDYLLPPKFAYSASVFEIDSKSQPAEMAAHPYNCPEMSGESKPCELPPPDPQAMSMPLGVAELPATPVRLPVSVVPLSIWNKRDAGRYERPKSYYSYHNSP